MSDSLEASMMKRIGELKAENARLKAECQARQAENSVLAVECDSLKGEVERLRKAGDAMAEALNLNDDVFDNQDKREAQANWLAAKQGKQP